MEEILDLVRPVNPDVKIAAVINQTPTLPSQFYRIFAAKDACASFGIPPLNTIVANRNVFDDADEAGSSVIEMDVDPKASAEIEALAKEFLEV
jgi:chromosome partitioning protein